VAGATRTMEKKRRGILDIICHELRSPIVGIQNNASHLQRRWTQLPQDHLMAKLGDILLDCSILSYQVIELERFLGRKPSNSHTKRAKTLLYRDLVKKTLTQYRSLLTAQGLDPDKVFVHANQFQQIPPLFIDTSKANQVLHNLITNAMKYAESDRDSFRVEIEAVETKNSYIVKMKDWGIGIDPDIRKRVFEHGFRAPLVVKNHIAGSGLGLSISRSLMREMGGDLVLEQLKRPTEFHLIFPKKLAMEAEAESHQHRGYK
jgi:signal transduction histidine kinase